MSKKASSFGGLAFLIWELRERERERERSQTLFRVLSKLGNFANLGLGLSFGRREKKGILIWWWGGVHLLVVTC